MINTRPVELLAPAKDLFCGKEAILHGADAVYIGAPKFSARSAAGNSIDDIHILCEFAHLYQAHVYVALNTILMDGELKEVEQMIRQIHDAGADALIVQDMGITRLDIPPIPLHASTQTDNCLPEKVEFLWKAGFSRIILARELSLKEIQTIVRRVPGASLEVFVHGSLCVCYSGRCYLSAALFGRSANRGACAQCCRLPYAMIDANDNVIIKKKHLLSLKDMNRSENLEALLKAGVTSLKIEGRLKDVSYVKNTVAYYRKKLDALFASNPIYYRSSVGQSTYTFEPQLAKSFNRGFTSYMLHGRDMDITSFDTPKFVGEPVGIVKRQDTFVTIANDEGGLFNAQINNGDGLTFFNSQGELEGFRVNRVASNRIFLQNGQTIKPGTLLYRNYDHAFETLLSKPSAERKIGVTLEWTDCPDGFTLTMTDETDARVIIVRSFTKDIARVPQDNTIRKQLAKLGNTPFITIKIIISMSNDYFVPSFLLNEMRRDATEQLLVVRRTRYARIPINIPADETKVVFPMKQLDFTANISNHKAEAFYKKYDAEILEPAFETQNVKAFAHKTDTQRFKVFKQIAEHSLHENTPLMVTKHCLCYSMGWCPVHQKTMSPYHEPYYLIYKDIRLRLTFDCKKCQMYVSISPEK